MKTVYILLSALGLSLGIILSDNFFDIENNQLFIPYIHCSLFFVCLTCIFLLLKSHITTSKEDKGQKKVDTKIATLILVVAVGALAGFERMNMWHNRTQIVNANLWDESIELHGTLDDVEYRLTHGVGYLILDDSSVNVLFEKNSPNLSNKQKSKIRLTFPRSHKLLPGDRLKIFGKLREPSDFVTEAGRIFNYQKFLARDRVYAMISYPNIKHLNTKRKDSNVRRFGIKRGLFKLKYYLLSQTNKHLHEPYAGLAGGILYGEQGQLTRSLQDIMRRTGIIHIVVLSGYNITIIAIIVFALLKKLPRIPRYLLAGLFMIAFMILTGASATTVRATVMSLVMICGSLIGRPGVIIKGLSYALIIMCMINPSYLIYDPGFQLSFLATIGLVCFGSPMMHLFRKIPERLSLREHASATFSTQITVLPALSVMTGEVSTVAPMVNLLVLPFVPFAMLASFLTQCLAIIHPLLGNLGSAISHGPLWLMVYVPTWFDTHFQSSLWLPILPSWIVVTTYTLMIPFLIWGYNFNQTSTENKVALL